MAPLNVVHVYSVFAITVVVVYLVYNRGNGRIADCQNETKMTKIHDKQSSSSYAIGSKMRVPNTVRTEYDTFASEKLNSLAARKASSEDSEVLQLVRYLLDEPSGHMRKISGRILPSPQGAVIDELFKQKKDGFFIEAGAYDGVESSNTLFLEQERQWKGLLIEADPYFYTQIIGKSRASWAINAAISTLPYVTKMDYSESYSEFGKLSPSSTNAAMKVPCFPLYSMLLALNRTYVDYFSLDVEGHEFEVLKALPLNKVRFGSISVEYVHSSHSKQAFIDYMARYGYVVHKDLIFSRDVPYAFAHDLIFVPKLT